MLYLIETPPDHHEAHDRMVERVRALVAEWRKTQTGELVAFLRQRKTPWLWPLYACLVLLGRFLRR